MQISSAFSSHDNFPSFSVRWSYATSDIHSDNRRFLVVVFFFFFFTTNLTVSVSKHTLVEWGTAYSSTTRSSQPLSKLCNLSSSSVFSLGVVWSWLAPQPLSGCHRQIEGICSHTPCRSDSAPKLGEDPRPLPHLHPKPTLICVPFNSSQHPSLCLSSRASWSADMSLIRQGCKSAGIT